MNQYHVLAALCASAAVAAWWITGRMRQYALARSLIDEIGARSSHATPTPRSGGVSVVVVGIVSFAVAVALGFPGEWSMALVVGGAAVALIGWIDDHGHLSPAVRLPVHFAAATWTVWWIGAVPLDFLGLDAPVARIVAPVLSVFGVVWLINLFNFMDGIDGIAASEAVCVTVGAAILLWMQGYGAAEGAPLMMLASATLGFLWWNWPPAKIFMGDTSSGFLGFSLATFMLIAGQLDGVLAFGVLILLGVFISDATVTLLYRALRRERVHEAHRSHAYQYLARRMGRHLPVTLLVIATNLVFLFPVAWLATTGRLAVVTSLVLAYGLLVIVAVSLGAGRREG